MAALGAVEAVSTGHNPVASQLQAAWIWNKNQVGKAIVEIPTIEYPSLIAIYIKVL